MRCEKCGFNKYDNLIRGYIEILHGDVFDQYLLFGKVMKVDGLDNVYLRIDKLFAKTFFHKPRLFWWNPFFPKREVVWYDFRDKPQEWNYKRGDIIDFPLKTKKWGLTHEVRESNKEEANKHTKKINKLCKIKGGWFGFP